MFHGYVAADQIGCSLFGSDRVVDVGFAIGHRLGESGFNLLAPAVTNAVAQQMISEDESGTIIIARVRYDIRRVTGDGITVSACAEFDVPADQQLMEMTIRWVQGEFAQRLAAPAVA